MHVGSDAFNNRRISQLHFCFFPRKYYSFEKYESSLTESDGIKD